jgi:hypothetical protein
MQSVPFNTRAVNMEAADQSETSDRSSNTHLKHYNPESIIVYTGNKTQKISSLKFIQFITKTL